MEIKLFGKHLFSYSKGKPEAEASLQLAANMIKESKYLPDFYKGFAETYPGWAANLSGSTDAIGALEAKIEGKTLDLKKSVTLTPKAVYEMKMLNDESFKLQTDPAYVDGQIETFKDKLSLITAEDYDMQNGVKEIGSIVKRLENRKKYPEFKEFFEQFPITTTARMEDLVKDHSYLQIGQVAQFLADMPKDATKIMKDFDAACVKMCGKKAIFYIIADKKDFQKTNKRRDPILLGQSPFGHFWNILGAWDKELLLIPEL